MYRLYSILVVILLASGSNIFGKAFKGAEYRTNEKFVYGRFEVNYKAAAGVGILSNFFTYHDFTTSSADWNEVDIEILGRYEDDIQFTTITPYQQIHNSHRYIPFNPTLDYHTYAFEWTPDYVAWFVDGQELYRQTGEHISTLIHPSKLMMNIWAPDGGDTWTGKWNPDILPVFAYYDWTSYASYTPGSGNVGTNNNFTFQWKDEFDTWDEDRWTGATHSWPGNRVDMLPENIVFSDGKLILCLTDEANPGYVDNKAPQILWSRLEGKTVTVHYSEAVDSIIARDVSKYSVSGATIEAVDVLPGHHSVELKLVDVDTSQISSVVVFGIKDQFPGNNTAPYLSSFFIKNKPLLSPLKINVGGPSIYKESWRADQIWGPEAQYGHMDGYVDEWPATIDVKGTNEDSLYLSSQREVVKYKVRVPDGIYDIVLHFAENKYVDSGKRSFDVNVEGTVIIQSLDLAGEVGSHRAFRLKAEKIAVNDGILDIHFNNWIDDSILSGLQVEQFSTSLKFPAGSPLKVFKLHQNYPNPFNPNTTIRYDSPAAADVRLDLYNILGQKINVLQEGRVQAGNHKFRFDAEHLAAGVYFYRLTARYKNFFFEDYHKMILVK